MTIADDIADALAEAREEFAGGRTITYHDGDGNSVDLSGLASLGATQLETTDHGGMVLQKQWMDLLVKATDLVLNGSITEPATSHTVKVTNELNVTVYDVARIGEEPCFRYRDSSHTELRIHMNESYTEPLT